jgi:hypothetical protein
MKMEDKDTIYKIFYIDENNKSISTLGKEIKLGLIEFSWYDIQRETRMFINKERYIMKYEYIEVKKNG